MTIWYAMIILHATSAVICFAAGFALLSQRLVRKYSWLVPTFLVSLICMITFMVGAVVSHWTDITVLERIIFSGLVGLGLYMLYRAIQAKRALTDGKSEPIYVDHIGFTLIALFNGFTIVALVDLGAPGWLVAIGAVLAAVVGSKLIARIKARHIATLST